MSFAGSCPGRWRKHGPQPWTKPLVRINAMSTRTGMDAQVARLRIALETDANVTVASLDTTHSVARCLAAQATPGGPACSTGNLFSTAGGMHPGLAATYTTRQGANRAMPWPPHSFRWASMMASSRQRLNCKRARSCLHTEEGPGSTLTSSLRPMLARRACTMLAKAGHGAAPPPELGDRPASAGSPRWACPLVTQTTSANGGADTY